MVARRRPRVRSRLAVLDEPAPEMRRPSAPLSDERGPRLVATDLGAAVGGGFGGVGGSGPPPAAPPRRASPPRVPLGPPGRGPPHCARAAGWGEPPTRAPPRSSMPGP